MAEVRQEKSLIDRERSVSFESTMVMMGLEKLCVVKEIDRIEPNHRVLKENRYTSGIEWRERERGREGEGEGEGEGERERERESER